MITTGVGWNLTNSKNQSQGFSEQSGSLEESFIAPQRFSLKALNSNVLENAKREDSPIARRTIMNILRHIHFMKGFVYAHVRNTDTGEEYFMKALPGLFVDSEITCYWAFHVVSEAKLKDFKLNNLVLDDGQSMILIPLESQSMNGKYFKGTIPENGYTIGKRQTKRYPCRNTIIEIIQDGFLAIGEILDFNPNGLRIKFSQMTNSYVKIFNSEAPVIIRFEDNKKLLYSGQWQCIREYKNYQFYEIVLIPTKSKIALHKKSKSRNPRQVLSPSPNLSFDHPFIKKRVYMEVSDISTSGFSVYEKYDNAVMVPGMVIPKAKIDIAGSNMECTCQVIYYRDDEGGKGRRCGIAILDMDLNEYSRLTDLLSHAINSHAYVSNNVNMDDLWEFFFKTGFIYQKKYRFIQSNKDAFKRTYEKIYQNNPEILRHFTYQQNGRIFGHVSMVRAYEKTWMVQHHAANAKENREAGFVVLKQIIQYLNGMFRLPSANAEYVMIYFRPENKFPSKVFGGFTKALNNPQNCSMDLFSYLPYTTLSLGSRFPIGWSLKESSKQDIWELNKFYRYYSGGLLLDVLRLEENTYGFQTLTDLYAKLGLKRNLKAYSLCYKGSLNAVLVLDQSDIGINLSDLLNGIKIIVTNKDSLPWHILSIAIGQLAPHYCVGKVPILIYPFEYVSIKSIPCEKQYQLWIYDARVMDQLMEFMKKNFRISYWK